MPSITPNLWFDTHALDAAEHYSAIFPDSKINSVSHYGEGGPRAAGSVLSVDFELDGQRFMAINGGPQFTIDEAVSFAISCKDQAEIDRYWEALGAGGEFGRCGWLKDRFGVSWQVIPDGLGALFSDPDPDRVRRATAAMMTMSKLDLDAMCAAADED